MSWGNFLRKRSYLDLDYIYGTLSNSGGENPLDFPAIMASSMELCIVACDAETGEVKYFGKDDIQQDDYSILKASSAIPFVCHPYEVKGHLYYDGALGDPIPIKKAFQMGCDRVVLILSKPKNLFRQPGKDPSFAKRIERRYPKAAEQLRLRARRYNDGVDLAKLYEARGQVLIVSPDDTCGVDTLTRDDELAPLLIPYLKESGYNYVEFLPLCEHPCDQSWGYQNTGFYAPTRRYGKPDDLKRLIDLLHQSGIGVILDFVPVHFAVDWYALAQYDGTALYEYPHSDVGVSEWGSYNFMHSRGEVRSFLQSAANFWLKEYHFDGLRMDAISRIIYWQGDEKRGVNGNAVDFIKVMNLGLKENNPDCILIAEDSTNYPGITKSVHDGGLGFDYKWDMGWMHDTLTYFQAAPAQRTALYHKLTFSMMYFQNEKYLLPFSHDEVVHGKATILQKMNGQYEQKFPQARAMYLYMLVHPGKKLNFMGNEFGQLREWDEKREQDWDLRKYPNHDAFYHYMAKLNDIYISHPALFEWDYRTDGFYWLDCYQENRCIYAICRKGKGEY